MVGKPHRRRQEAFGGGKSSATIAPSRGTITKLIVLSFLSTAGNSHISGFFSRHMPRF